MSIFFRIKIVALNISNGATARKEYSSSWTVKQFLDCGGCTRTSLT